MHTFKLAFIIFAFIFLSCQDQNIVEQSSEKGTIKLSFDKTAIPDVVVSINATLTREGFNPVSGSMNILSPGSAELTLENLEAGVWHLKVDAIDANNQIVYSGETNVEIIPNTTTPVQLTLEPIQNNTGSIHIIVNWGVTPNPTEWNDYGGNPVLTKAGSLYDTYGVALPQVIFEDGIYKMWYTGLGPSNGIAYVLYATSPDGISWTKYNNPVLSPSISGWDSKATTIGAIYEEDGSYKMYYNGFSDAHGTWSIGLAVSNDGINWEKHPTPVLEGIENTWEAQITAGDVELVGDKYYLYFTGRRNQTQHKIGLATSFDGITWTRHSSNPILEAEEVWEGIGVAYPSILNEDGVYKMIYGSLN